DPEGTGTANVYRGWADKASTEYKSFSSPSWNKIAVDDIIAAAKTIGSTITEPIVSEATATEHTLVGNSYYQIGYTPGNTNSSACQALWTYTSTTTTAEFVADGDTNSTIVDLGLVANPIFATDTTLNNGTTSYFYSTDQNVIGADDNFTTVGFFTQKIDAITFLSEQGLPNCSVYFP
ncbi:MAG: hypothetical protein Q9M34_01140, partial [Sulfurimonas sp.]|nr:hypothetical protein [Sulfurimonas sp.]